MTQNEAEAPKLLHCPFCASTADLLCTAVDDDDRAPRPHYKFIVECTRCEARVSETSTRWFDERSRPEFDEADLKARAEAVAKWNRREGASPAR